MLLEGRATMGLPGSPNVIQRLVEENADALYRYAYRLSGSSADAEDLVQETFCKAQQSLSQLRDASRVRPWLFSILRRAYLHQVRAARSHPCVLLEAAGDVAEPLPESLPEVDPEQLQQALNELPVAPNGGGMPTPIIPFYFEEVSYPDIAEQI